MSRIGTKPKEGVAAESIIRIQKLLDELRREVEALKSRVTTLGG